MILAPRSKVTVIVPMYNAARTIVACLESLLANEAVRPEDVIVVDNLSTDSGAEAASGLGVTVADCHRKGPAAARNVGLEMSVERSPEYIAFVDADVALDGGWIDKAIAFLGENPGVSGVSGVVRSMGVSVWERALDVGIWGQPQSSGVSTSAVATLATMAVLYRGSHVEGLRFDERLVAAEDPEYSFAVRGRGGELVISGGLEIRHHNPDSGVSLLRKWFRYGLFYPAPYVRHADERSAMFFCRMAFVPSVLAAMGVACVLRGFAASVLVLTTAVALLWTAYFFNSLRAAVCGPWECAALAVVHTAKFLSHQMGIWAGLPRGWGYLSKEPS